MKYLLALLLGAIVGALLFTIGLIYNPFIGVSSVSPLSFSNEEQIVLSYSGVADEGILFTNDGESRVQPHPEKVLQLWEPPIRKTSILATILRDARNQVAGLGIKMSSLSEDTNLLQGEALINSVWYVYLPNRGSVFVQQSENRWGFLRDVVLAAYRSSAKTWKGVWTGALTAGPGALGTGHVTGGTGEFANRELLGVESLSVKAWSAAAGELAAQGTLTFEFSESPQPAGSSPDSGRVESSD